MMTNREVFRPLGWKERSGQDEGWRSVSWAEGRKQAGSCILSLLENTHMGGREGEEGILTAKTSTSSSAGNQDLPE